MVLTPLQSCDLNSESPFGTRKLYSCVIVCLFPLYKTVCVWFYLKGTVHPKLKFHPFPTHRYMEGASGDIF